MRQRNHDSDEQYFSLDSNDVADVGYRIRYLFLSFLTGTSDSVIGE